MFYRGSFYPKFVARDRNIKHRNLDNLIWLVVSCNQPILKNSSAICIYVLCYNQYHGISKIIEPNLLNTYNLPKNSINARLATKFV